tara:strand:- start:702 stop:1181 length:480 start_codon:yes stop_codon:yes gene_type:complete
MSKLSSQQFDRIAKRLFGELLEPYGFTCEGSKWSTFYRKIDDDVYHFVATDKLRSTPKYDVHVFPHSPLLRDDFHQLFPDEVGFITGASRLSKNGVGISPEQYFCRTHEGFERDFNARVKPYILEFALPYLEGITTVHDVAAAIKTGPALQVAKERGFA